MVEENVSWGFGQLFCACIAMFWPRLVGFVKEFSWVATIKGVSQMTNTFLKLVDLNSSLYRRRHEPPWHAGV